MKRAIIILVGVYLTCGFATNLLAENDIRSRGIMLAQALDEEEDFLGGEGEEPDEEAARKNEEERKRREEEEKRRKEEEAKKQEEAARAAVKKREIKDQKAAKAKADELNALREKAAETTEYTLDPSSVKFVVDMGYGFRTRNHRMTMSGDFDFFLRGRGMLHYDYRFFSYLSLGILAGIDWTDLSLYSRFRDQLSKPVPKQFSILGGLAARIRLTEWYLRSAIFIEPSCLFGHMWQTLVTQDTTHWRLRPGLFGSVETVFDSGLSLTTRIGAEFPFDFGSPNPVQERIEPLFLVGLGFAI